MDARLETAPLWEALPPSPRFGPLEADVQGEVCVIGAGIVGLTTALLLSRDRRVVLLDAGPIGDGETRRSTAHLTTLPDARFDRLLRQLGEDDTRLLATHLSIAIDRMESLVLSHAIDCDFERVDGFLFAPPGSDRTSLERERAAAHRAGLLDVEWAGRAPTLDLDTGVCLRFPGQAQLDPMRYLEGLLEQIAEHDTRIHPFTRAVTVEGGTPTRVVTQAGHVITADAVVVATHSPMHHGHGLHAHQTACRSYVIAAPVPSGRVGHALWWDTSQSAEDESVAASSYHYARIARAPRGDGEYLVVGGEDHRTGQAEDTRERFERLERWARERFHCMGEVEYRWSGQVLEPFDSVPFVGADPEGAEHVYVATGTSGYGMTAGTAAAHLIADLVRGEESPWTALYSPGRSSRAKASRSAKKDLGAAVKVVRRMLGAGTADTSSIEPGGGAVITRGNERIAVHRDEDGALHMRSAVCPHLGCTVSWNAAARTCDCPCHGSRFSTEGRVLNGPAAEDLAEYDEGEAP